MRNETGRTIQYEPGGPVYPRPSEAEIHAANAMVDPRNCDCLACLVVARDWSDRLPVEADAEDNRRSNPTSPCGACPWVIRQPEHRRPAPQAPPTKEHKQ